ncbi:MAG: type I-E CRISPR-associated protein Cas7/Cse4/CasC [Clostridia bacterium]
MENKQQLYLDVHVLQTVPPSCLNRDDTGSPKTAVYGGVTRARVSSQCWKHAQRLMFKELFPAEMLGVRTKHLVALIAQEVHSLSADVDAEKLALYALELAKITMKKEEKKPEKGEEKDPKNETAALFFISNAQIKAIARLIVEQPELFDSKAPAKDKAAATESVKAALRALPGIDVALFGRMVADDPSLNNDACAQVAHSISTHAVHNEYDYFTAVDDCAPEDNAGAGHIGTVEFNSATLYRYATVAVHCLQKQLKKDTVSAIRGFVEAFVRSMPTGKQNTFASRTLPNAVYVTLRMDQPINLVGAFEKPVQADGNGYVESSIHALCEQAQKTYREYVKAPALSLAIGDSLADIATVMPLHELLDTLETWLEEHLGKEDA